MPLLLHSQAPALPSVNNRFPSSRKSLPFYFGCHSCLGVIILLLLRVFPLFSWPGNGQVTFPEPKNIAPKWYWHFHYSNYPSFSRTRFSVAWYPSLSLGFIYPDITKNIPPLTQCQVHIVLAIEILMLKEKVLCRRNFPKMPLDPLETYAKDLCTKFFWGDIYAVSCAAVYFA